LSTATINETELLIVILELGIAIIVSLIVAKFLGKRGIPEVLGLIFGGIILQFVSSTVGFPTPPSLDIHYLVTTIALGFIGYNIGAKMDLRMLRRESKGLLLLLVGEAIGAFIIVTVIISIFLRDHVIALLLGSIAIATAPASTAKVLSDYNAKGPLCSTILFIIAFDDILAIIFFNIALSYAESYYSSISQSLINTILPILADLLGSVALGVVLALVLKPFHKADIDASKIVEVTFPAILICIALAGLFHFSIILSTIVFGNVLASLAKFDYKECQYGIERLYSPIIALFFILIGFELNLGLLITYSSILVVVILYFLARSLGKSIGAWSGAYLGDMPEQVRQNIPFALLTQAGVAVGLAAITFTRLNELGTTPALTTAILLLDIVVMSVIISEIIGPLLVKRALVRSGEVRA